MPLRDKLFQSTFTKLFVYNILFEDSEVDETYLNIQEDSSVLAITGAGCTVAGMLSGRPQRIDAVDINPHHLALTALKVAAAQKAQSYSEFYDLFGRGWAARPEVVVNRLTGDLPKWIQKYWKRHHKRFEQSMLHRGLTAQMLSTLRKATGLDDQWLREFIPLSLDERMRIIDEQITPVLHKPHFKAFLKSPVQLVALGINFQQRDRLVETEQLEILDYFVEHLKRVASTDVETNWFGWYVVAGQYNHDNPDAVPPYLRADRFERSKGAPTRARFHNRNLFDILGSAGPETWSHYSLCDAPDWLPHPVQQQLLDEIYRTSRDGAIVVARSVDGEDMVSSCGQEKRFRRMEAESEAATRDDRSRQYRSVNFYRVHHAA